MANKILSGDEPCVELDGYRLPDGDPVLVVGREYFRFSFGSQPFDQTDIYKQAAKLVDMIAEYKKGKSEAVLKTFKVKRRPDKELEDKEMWFQEGAIRTCYVVDGGDKGWNYLVPLREDGIGTRITFKNEEHLLLTFEKIDE